MNFLTELAFWIYDNNINGLNQNELEDYFKYYKGKFNLPIPVTEIQRVLSNVNICRFDTFNQYHFCYDYLYFFFIAKYLSEHIEEKKKLMQNESALRKVLEQMDGINQ